MHVITRKRLKDFAARHPDAGEPLNAWYRVVRRARWGNLRDVRVIYPHADAVKVASGRTATVFNVAGNKYRLVTAIHYDRQRVYILAVLTHAAYSRDTWKDGL